MQIEEPKSIEAAPAGAHVAMLVKLIDLGWQDNTFQGKTTRQHQAMLTWELSDELNSSGRPLLVSKTINLSMHEKATFRKWAEVLAGRKFGTSDLYGRNRFNVKNLLGQLCLLQIDNEEREGRTYAKIMKVMPLPAKTPKPTQLTDLIYFSLEPGEFDEEVFESLSPWAKEKIRLSKSLTGSGRARRPLLCAWDATGSKQRSCSIISSPLLKRFRLLRR